MAIKLNKRMQGAASGKYLNNRRASLRNVTGGAQGGIAPGDNPKGQTDVPGAPRGTNAQGYDMIRYGQNKLKWGYAKVGQARNQGLPPEQWGGQGNAGGGGGGPYDTGWGQGQNGGQGNGGGQGTGNGGQGQGNGGNAGPGLPTLSPRLRAFLQEYGSEDYNPNDASAWWSHGGEWGGGIPVDAVRRFLRNGKAAGLSNKELLALTNQSFLKGVVDPGTKANDESSTGAGPPRYIQNNYSPEQWQSLSAFAGGMTPNMGSDGGAPDPGNGMYAQTALLDEFPDLWNKYARMASIEQRTIDRFNYEHGLPTSEGFVPPVPEVQEGSRNNRAAFANSPTAASQAPYSNDGSMMGAGQVGGGGNRPGQTGQPGQTIGMTGTGNQIADAAAQAQAQQAANQTQMQLSQLPLDPQFEGQRRVLQAQLDRQLSEINASYGRLGAEQGLAQSRLDTNRGVDEQSLLENMAGRGTYNSSIYGDERGQLATDYGRMQTDLGISIADALAQLSGQQGDAYSNYDQGLIELLSQSASGFMEDPLSSGMSQQGYTMGGGGGNWKPTWKPKNKRGRRGRGGNR